MLAGSAGLAPMAISGSVLFKPLAITIISGLLFSMLLTLIVVPSLYTVVALQKEKKRERVEKQQEAPACV